MTETPQYRGLRPNPQKLGVVPLGPDEGSEKYRVRAPLAVLERFAAMNAGQRGAFLVRAFEQLEPLEQLEPAK